VQVPRRVRAGGGLRGLEQRQVLSGVPAKGGAAAVRRRPFLGLAGDAVAGQVCARGEPDLAGVCRGVHQELFVRGVCVCQSEH